MLYCDLLDGIYAVKYENRCAIETNLQPSVRLAATFEANPSAFGAIIKH